MFNFLKKKQLISGGGSEVVTKDCEDSCVEQNISQFGIKYITKCCTTDNCNFSSNLRSNKLFVFFIGIITAKFFL